MQILHTEPVFNTGLVATQTGVHRLLLRFNGQYHDVSAEIEESEEIIFDLSECNEDYTYTCLEVVQPNGVPIFLEDPVLIKINL